MLVEKPKVSLKMPALFSEIIKNDAALRVTKESPVVSFSTFKQQRADQREFQRTAEKIYAGTKNKGKEI
jgi:hypothetical protein